MNSNITSFTLHTQNLIAEHLFAIPVLLTQLQTTDIRCTKSIFSAKDIRSFVAQNRHMKKMKAQLRMKQQPEQNRLLKTLEKNWKAKIHFRNSDEIKFTIER